MSQERIEAAAKAHYQSSPHSETWERADAETRQWFLGRIARGLEAADAVMFSDEAIERAAQKLYVRGNPHGDWAGHTEAVRNIYRNEIKFLIAALKGDA